MSQNHKKMKNSKSSLASFPKQNPTSDPSLLRLGRRRTILQMKLRGQKVVFEKPQGWFPVFCSRIPTPFLIHPSHPTERSTQFPPSKEAGENNVGTMKKKFEEEEEKSCRRSEIQRNEVFTFQQHPQVSIHVQKFGRPRKAAR